jgi:hypothetical protein
VADAICSIDGCERPAVNRRGWCSMHYHRWQRHDDPTVVLKKRLPFGTTTEERFWAKVDKDGPVPEVFWNPNEDRYQPADVSVGGCWLWTASRLRFGHGSFGAVPGSTVLAHRFAYELLVGSVPDDMAVEHLCRNPPCVNPGHLEVITHTENNRRGFTEFVARTQCAYGHKLTPENCYYRKPGRPLCRQCRREQHQAWRNGPGRESVRRSEAKRRSGRSPGSPRRTHCKQGHLYTEATTYVRPDGKRQCRICRDRYYQEIEQPRRRQRKAS